MNVAQRNDIGNPWGLELTGLGYQYEGIKANKYLFNQGTGDKRFNTERIFDYSLNVDFTLYRVYDPAIGRWWQVDPKADKGGQETWSPYQYGFDNPILNNDPYGDCITCLTQLVVAKYRALATIMTSTSSQGSVTRLMTKSSSTIQQQAGRSGPTTSIDNKNLAIVNDAMIVTDNVARNSKILTNEVSKDGLAAVQAVGTGMEIAGMGTPLSGAGAVVTGTVGVLDQGRQVAFENKSLMDAGVEIGVSAAVNALFGAAGDKAKSTVSTFDPSKEQFDKVVDGYSFGFSNLFQWVSDKIRGSEEEEN